MTASTKIVDFIEERTGEEYRIHPYYMFEPFDVEKRKDWILEQMKKDNVDLYSPNMISTLGRDPHPFQAGYCLDSSFLSLMLAGTQTGKALTLDSEVYTKRGAIRMGDVCVGDKVLGPDGDERTVLTLHNQGVRPVYRLTFDDESSCECDIDHLWKYLPKKRASKNRWSHGKKEINPYYNQWKVETLREIIESVGEGEIPEHRRPVFPVVGSIDFEKKDYKLSPYIIGALLGDGCITNNSPSITCHQDDEEIIDRVRKELPAECSIQRRPSSKLSWGFSGIVPYLRELSLIGTNSRTKFIPERYKYSSHKDRLALLQGLMDTDGYISDTSCMEFMTVGKQLAGDLQWLVRSLGGKVKIKEKNTSYKKDGVRVDCGIGYRCIIKLDSTNPFFLKRKATKFYTISRRKERHLRRIDRLEDKETRCFTLNAEDGLFITNDFIVTHNSYCALVDNIIQLTGELPFAFKHDKGVKTGIRRIVNEENIRRFGRRDKKTEAFLDYNVEAIQDTSWDCGEIVGIGRYPKEKIAEPGSKIWLCTFKQARDEYWWPRFKKLIPDHLLDKRKGNQGFYSSDGYIVYLSRGCEIHIITYEQGFERVEAEKVHCIHLDEEPPDERFFTAASTHCHRLRMTMTPYRGFTFSHEKLFKRASELESLKIYHCTQYDSPYHTKKTINQARGFMKPWEIGARVYGLHSEQVGKPYYDRELVTRKLRDEYLFGWKRVDIYPVRPWSKVSELFCSDVFAVDNEEGGWEIYEDPEERHAYWISIDTAIGSDNPDEAQDFNCAHIFRLPVNGEDSSRPIHVGCLHTSMDVTEFARLTLYAAVYYNNALIAPEIMGQSAGTYLAEVRDYPFLFTMTVINDKTRKPTEKAGFITSVKTRIMLFDLIGSHIKEYEQISCFGINHAKTIQEIAGCIVGKKGRPDHPRGGSTDCLIAFGIGLYVFSHAHEQIQNRSRFNKKAPTQFDWGGRIKRKNTKPMLGSKI